jgi:CysZ protein
VGAGVAQQGDGLLERGLLGGFGGGAALVAEGFRLLRSERRLWPLALVPFLFSVVAISLAVALVYLNAGELHLFVTSWLPEPQVEAWYQWLWLGPAKGVLWLLGHLLFVALAGLSVVLAMMLANLAAAPFLDALAYRVECLLQSQPLEQSSGLSGLVRDVRRSLVNESQRMLFFVAIWVVLAGAGMLVPGAHLITGPMALALTILFLPLEYSGFTLDRRQVDFRTRRGWISANLAPMAGFGSAAFVCCFVPGLNLLVIPVLVVAGTLLAMRHPPDS